MRLAFINFFFMLALLLAANIANAQVTRENDTKSIARVLDGQTDDFTFQSRGNELVLADIDASIYQTNGPGVHDETAEGEDGGCEEGGPSNFCIQVLNSSGSILCWASRPGMPGWQRDPALACVLPATPSKEQYTLRVSTGDENCGDDLYPFADPNKVLFYLLNVSVRVLAPEGSLDSAASISRK